MSDLKFFEWRFTVFGCPKKGSYYGILTGTDELNVRQHMKELKRIGGVRCWHCGSRHQTTTPERVL